MWVGEMDLQKSAIESDSTTIYVQAQRGIEQPSMRPANGQNCSEQQKTLSIGRS